MSFAAVCGAINAVYVCNCNGLRHRDVCQAVDAGAQRPAEVFRRCGAAPQCAKCVCEIKTLIADRQAAFKFAAE